MSVDVHGAQSVKSTTSQMSSTMSRASAPRDFGDSFGAYLRRISARPLLTASDEVALARRIEVGMFAAERLAVSKNNPRLLPEESRELLWLVNDGSRAKNHFIEANLRLVVSIAKHFFGRGTPAMDIIQDGNLGLVRAVEKYDFMTGNKFSTYATWWIRHFIHQGLATHTHMIRIPSHTAERIDMVKRVRRDLTVIFNREPTLAEIAHDSRLPLLEISRLLSFDVEPVSFSTIINDGAGEFSDLIEDGDQMTPHEHAVLTLRNADVSDHLNHLPFRERSILIAHFGLDGNEPRTVFEIAAEHGISAERIRQIEKRALISMRVSGLAQYLLE